MDVYESYENEKYLLNIVYDADPSDPREWDNIGNMVCFHSRYSLGDKHDYSDPHSAIRDIILSEMDNLKMLEVVDRIKNGEFEAVKLEYNPRVKEWAMTHYSESRNKWDMVECFDLILERELDYVFSNFIECLSMGELLELAQECIVTLPLYLYDHSGITMNTTGFNCRWDSGQVGFIYVTKQELSSELGKPIDAELIKRGYEILEGEVDDYDKYINGDAFGFVLKEKNGQEDEDDYEEIDSCYGFLGSDMDKNGLFDNLPLEALSLVC